MISYMRSTNLIKKEARNHVLELAPSKNALKLEIRDIIIGVPTTTVNMLI